MRRRAARAAVTLLAAGAALAGAAAAGAAPVELLRTGTVPRSEVTSKNGEVWFGIFDSSGVVIARPSVVLVAAPRAGAGDSARTASSAHISILGGGAPLFLVRGIERLRTGIVPTLIRKPRALRAGEIVFLPLASDARYRLRADAPSEPDSSGAREYRLSLERMGLVAEGTRIVFQAPARETPRPIVWAGDIDRDDRLDFLMETGAEEGVSEWSLFLSDPVRGPEMVVRAATLRCSAP